MYEQFVSRQVQRLTPQFTDFAAVAETAAAAVCYSFLICHLSMFALYRGLL